MWKSTAALLGLLLSLLIDVGWAQQTVSFSTYLGGPGAQESINDIRVDSAGNAYVTYEDYDDTGPSHDFMVSKIGANGAKGYTTVLGHFHSEEGATGIAVDAFGNAYITGWAQSYPTDHPRFPSLNALQPEPGGGVDGVLVKLNPQGEVVFSTYLGGSGNDYGRDIALDSSGNIYVAGVTSSDDFPIRNAYQPARNRGGALGMDVFITKINPSGSVILYSTYLGGDDDDSVASIAVDADSSIYIAGSSRSSSFAGRSDHLKTQWNGYAAKFNPGGSALLYSFVWSDSGKDHRIVRAQLDSGGNLYIAESDSVRKLNPSGKAVYSKNIPAGVSAVAVDSKGNAYAVGRTTVDSPGRSSSARGRNDLYIAKIPPDGGPFVFTTSLNGTTRNQSDPDSGATAGTAIAVSSSGAVYVGGYSESLNFPTTNGSTRSRWTPASTQDAILFIIQPD